MTRKSAVALMSSMSHVEQAEQRYNHAVAALDAGWADNDKLFSNKTSDNLKKGVTIEQFKASLEGVAKLGMIAFRSFDAWQHSIAHKDDIENVPVEDVRGVLTASLSDKLGDLKFTVNYGILASNVAKAIKRDTQEAELDVPYCADHR